MQIFPWSSLFIALVVVAPNVAGVNAVAAVRQDSKVQPLLDSSNPVATDFEIPMRIECDGMPLEVEPPGYACPTMVDLEGKGIQDLVVGQFSQGNLLHCRNEALAGKSPQFSKPQWLMSKTGRAFIPGIRCCTSSTPQFVDWNGDGRLDLLSGCYATPGFPAGHLLLLLGETDHTFSSPIYLTGSQNQRLQNADFNQPGDQQQKILDSVCTHQHAVDLDADGDLDLLVGSSGGRLFYYENLGSARAPILKQPPELLPIRSPVGRSAPHCVDWNGDGLLDLLTGGSEGGVYLSLNQGAPHQPKWSELTTLISPTMLFKQNAGDQLQPGHSWRVWAHDWNGDGKLDLLVGDSVSLLSPREGVAETEFKQRKQELDDHELLLKATEAAIAFAPNAGEKQTEPTANQLSPVELQAKLQQIRLALNQLESQRHTWAAEKKTGFVWLYLRK